MHFGSSADAFTHERTGVRKTREALRGRCASPSPRLLPIGGTGHVAAPALESGVGLVARVLWAKCLVREGDLPTPGPPGGPGRNHQPRRRAWRNFNCARAHAPRGPLETAGAAPLAAVNLKLKEESSSQEVCKLAGAARKACGQVRGGRAPGLRLPRLWAQRPLRTGEDLGRGAAVGGAWVEECLLFVSRVRPAPRLFPARPAGREQGCGHLAASLPDCDPPRCLARGSRGTDRSSPLTVVCP